ncbi:hypothetical protein [Mycobacterium tilburgii]|uniref:hypothetical protein n=1 Tax=Mycobacterium tilburgii TaxID=44467 RepID=UPI0021B28EEE
MLDDHTVAYLDLFGSGVETTAHLRDNGRITLMFCSFSRNSRILRLFGTGRAMRPDDDEFPGLLTHFGHQPVFAPPSSSTWSASPMPADSRYPTTSSSTTVRCWTTPTTPRRTSRPTCVPSSATSTASTGYPL